MLILPLHLAFANKACKANMAGHGNTSSRAARQVMLSGSRSPGSSPLSRRVLNQPGDWQVFLGNKGDQKQSAITIKISPGIFQKKSVVCEEGFSLTVVDKQGCTVRSGLLNLDLNYRLHGIELRNSDKELVAILVKVNGTWNLELHHQSSSYGKAKAIQLAEPEGDPAVPLSGQSVDDRVALYEGLPESISWKPDEIKVADGRWRYLQRPEGCRIALSLAGLTEFKLGTEILYPLKVLQNGLIPVKEQSLSKDELYYPRLKLANGAVLFQQLKPGPGGCQFVVYKPKLSGDRGEAGRVLNPVFQLSSLDIAEQGNQTLANWFSQFLLAAGSRKEFPNIGVHTVNNKPYLYLNKETFKGFFERSGLDLRVGSSSEFSGLEEIGYSANPALAALGAGEATYRNLVESLPVALPLKPAQYFYAVDPANREEPYPLFSLQYDQWQGKVDIRVHDGFFKFLFDPPSPEDLPAVSPPPSIHSQ